MRSAAPLLLTLLGVLMLAGSLLWPMWDDGRSAWTDEQAKRYTEVGQEMHRLSFSRPTPENLAELERAKAESESLRNTLESARGRGSRVAWTLRVVAAVLVVAGIVARRVTAEG